MYLENSDNYEPNENIIQNINTRNNFVAYKIGQNSDHMQAQIPIPQNNTLKIVPK